MQRCFWQAADDEPTLEDMAQAACALLGRTGHLREDLVAALAFGVQAMAWHCYLRPWANAAEVATAVTTGQAVLAVAYSEPGGAPGRLQTTARPDGDGWLLSGSKHYITNGPVADWFMVFATVAGQPPRREAFLVPATAVQVSAMAVPPLLTGLPHGRLDCCDIPVSEAQRLPEAQALDAGRRLRRAEDSLRLALLGAAVCAIVRRSTSNERQAAILGEALLVEELALATLEALEAGRAQRQRALALAGLEAAQTLGAHLQGWSIAGDDEHMQLLQALPAALGRGDASRLHAGLGRLAASGGQRQDGP
jgi:alkylation response protein AidB-like acyl-CoA dehydrogenase